MFLRIEGVLGSLFFVVLFQSYLPLFDPPLAGAREAF
jgi:hypothetical protein